eukprot:6203046-Pleurochrysis_carterae.AAC.6
MSPYAREWMQQRRSSDRCGLVPERRGSGGPQRSVGISARPWRPLDRLIDAAQAERGAALAAQLRQRKYTVGRVPVGEVRCCATPQVGGITQRTKLIAVLFYVLFYLPTFRYIHHA